MRGLKRLNPLKDPSAPESLLMNEPVKRLTLVSDAWHPQVNGVVRTIENTNRELAKMGMEVTMITPDMFRNMGMPTYPEIRLALASYRHAGPCHAETFGDVHAQGAQARPFLRAHK